MAPVRVGVTGSMIEAQGAVQAIALPGVVPTGGDQSDPDIGVLIECGRDRSDLDRNACNCLIKNAHQCCRKSWCCL